MPVSILGIDSNFEPLTLAAFNYREAHVYPHFTTKGFTVDKCQGVEATKASVDPKAQLPDVAYLTGVGHGADDAFLGDGFGVVFQVPNYPHAAVSGNIVHFLSCFTANQLGKDFVQNGCLAYFSYDEEFLCPDPYQNIFFECDSEIDRAFADGLTAARVYNRVKSLFQHRAAELWNVPTTVSYQAAAALEQDLDALRCPSSPPGTTDFGDPHAKLP